MEITDGSGGERTRNDTKMLNQMRLISAKNRKMKFVKNAVARKP